MIMENDVGPNSNKCTYMILGDGDFSYSLDLARFLRSYHANPQHYHTTSTSSNSSNLPKTNKIDKSYKIWPFLDRSTSIHLIATGIDTYEELSKKYKDSDSILGKLKSMETAAISEPPCKKPKIDNKIILPQSSSTFSVSIQHSINAIQPPTLGSLHMTKEDVKISSSILVGMPKKYHIVIFNHPHLGTEDARMHQRFLSHFFHSCLHVWLSKGGVLHLTLAVGQCERWKAMQSARRLGLQLLHRTTFQPPPILSPPSASFSSQQQYYQHRRHQNGKSFASRTTHQSETFTFGRIDDEQGGYISKCLPWQIEHFRIKEYKKEDNFINKGQKKTKNKKQSTLQILQNSSNLFPCPYCPKSFREQRSVKNHIRNVHPDPPKILSNSISNTITTDDIPSSPDLIICEICNPPLPLHSDQDHCPRPKPRIFRNAEALKAHQIAKHNGLYTDIKPDWWSSSSSNTIPTTAKKHIPSKNVSSTDSSTINTLIDASKAPKTIFGSCSICQMTFYTKKDQIQHPTLFIPSSSLEVEKDENQCQFCQKWFREKRGLFQHLNFCSQKVKSQHIPCPIVPAQTIGSE